jgi:small subunit ribosomal protein S20
MAITKSAKREIKRNLKRRLFNLEKKRKIKFAVKNFLKALKNKNEEEARKYLSLAYKYIDKAGKTFMHKNKCARLKSRLTLKFNKVFSK